MTIVCFHFCEHFFSCSASVTFTLSKNRLPVLLMSKQCKNIDLPNWISYLADTELTLKVYIRCTFDSFCLFLCVCNEWWKIWKGHSFCLKLYFQRQHFFFTWKCFFKTIAVAVAWSVTSLNRSCLCRSMLLAANTKLKGCLGRDRGVGQCFKRSVGMCFSPLTCSVILVRSMPSMQWGQPVPQLSQQQFNQQQGIVAYPMQQGEIDSLPYTFLQQWVL